MERKGWEWEWEEQLWFEREYNTIKCPFCGETISREVLEESGEWACIDSIMNDYGIVYHKCKCGKILKIRMSCYNCPITWCPHNRSTQ